MKTRILLLPLALILLLSFTQCAKRGRPTGGPIDSIPPRPVKIHPQNYQTNFNERTILVQFDEYIRLNKLQENLIISPPLERTPVIKPYSVSRILEIQLEDNLQPQTTYTFNFGNSIVDNNEGNVLEQFKYVFSTGSHIDSLEINGKVIDSRLLKLKKRTNVNLYRLDEKFHDSIVEKGIPSYVSITDEEGNFQFTNLAEGKYLLAAIQKSKEGNQYTYQAEEDKFAFYPEPIEIPSEETYDLDLYKAQPSYKMNRPEFLEQGLLRFAYKSDGTIPEIELLDKSSDTQTYLTKEVGKDSLYLWYQPEIEKDSLNFKVSYKNTSENFKIRINKELKPKDFKLSASEIYTPTDQLELKAATPIVKIDESFIELNNQNGASIAFKAYLNQLNNTIHIDFNKDYEEAYQINMSPGAFTDWKGNSNDSLKNTFKIKAESEYGSIHLNLLGVSNYPILVDLLDSSSKLIRTAYLTEEKQIDFLHLNKAAYFVRVSQDLNKNGKWDTGHFPTRTQPEPVFFFHTPIEVHANWSVSETLQITP